MTDKRIEAAARALAAYAEIQSVDQPSDEQVAEYVEDEWHLYVEDVNAAIAAFLAAAEVPSLAMLHSGHQACRKPPEQSMASADECWRAMLAALRKELTR